ncbi:CBS domain-containing protein [bacterium]|nr:CBS domain-containing protein [bacterium]
MIINNLIGILSFLLFTVIDFFIGKVLNLSFTNEDNSLLKLKGLIGLELLNIIFILATLYFSILTLDFLKVWYFILILLFIFVITYLFIRMLLAKISLSANSKIMKSFMNIGLSMFWFPIFLPITAPFFLLFKKRSNEIFSHNYPSYLTEEQLLKIIERDSELEDGEKDMLTSIIGFSSIKANEIMIPRTEVISVNNDEKYENILKLVKAKGFSRLPVYKEGLDNIVGVLYVKDLIGLEIDDFNIEKLMRKAVFMPETAKLDELLKTVIEKKVQIMIILDEYGGTSGIITLEDIIEEIVGEIEDEYDKHTKEIEKIEKNKYKIKSSIEIEVISEKLNIHLPKIEGIETIGGFILYYMEKIPKKGETMEYNNIHFRILDADERKINWILMTIRHKA